MEYKLTRGIEPELITEWVAFVESQRTGSLFQWPLWSDLFNPKTHIWLYFWGEEDHQIRLVALIKGRRILGLGVDYMIERGPVCDDERVLLEGIKVLIAHLQKEKAIRLRVNPYWEFPLGAKIESGLREVGFASAQQKNDSHYETLSIGLSKSPEEILKGLRKTTRYEIKRAKNLGLSVRPGLNEEDVSNFYQLLKTMSQNKKIRIPTGFFFKKLCQDFFQGESSGILLLTYYRDLLVSGLIVLKHGERAVYSWGASTIDANEKIPKSYLAMWEGLLWAKNRGCLFFDLGGYGGEQNKSSGMEDIDLFKKGFGGEFCQLVKIHQYTFNKTKEKWLSSLLSKRNSIRG